MCPVFGILSSTMQVMEIDGLIARDSGTGRYQLTAQGGPCFACCSTAEGSSWRSSSAGKEIRLFVQAEPSANRRLKGPRHAVYDTPGLSH
jgi:hypothetical protein